MDEHAEWKNKSIENNNAVLANTGIVFPRISNQHFGMLGEILEHLGIWKKDVDTKTEENYKTSATYVKDTNLKMDELNREVVTTHRIRTIYEIFGSAVRRLIGFQTGGYVARTGPYILHAGEYVVPKKDVGDKRGDIILNVSYDIQVSDREEMERLLRYNNQQLVEEVKRQVAI
jgi:hypothetical protein